MDMLFNFRRYENCVRFDEWQFENHHPKLCPRKCFLQLYDFTKSFDKLEDFAQFSPFIALLLQTNFHDIHTYLLHYEQSLMHLNSIENPYASENEVFALLLHPNLIRQFQYLIHFPILQTQNLQFIKSLLAIDIRCCYDNVIEDIIFVLVDCMCRNNYHRMLQQMLISQIPRGEFILQVDQVCQNHRNFHYLFYNCAYYHHFDCFKIVFTHFKQVSDEFMTFLVVQLPWFSIQDHFVLFLLKLVCHNFPNISLHFIFRYCNIQEHEASLSFLRRHLACTSNAKVDPIEFSKEFPKYHEYLQYYEKKLQMLRENVPVCDDCISVVETFL